jgi:hypothetical protein
VAAGSEGSRGSVVTLVLFFLILTGSVCLASGQSPDYRTIFGDDWVKAGRIIQENRDWMQKASKRMGIPYAEAVAVIFPELIRYSALRDRMETTLLKTLYINLGEEYADFSIGPFQMKPSFAEQLHTELSVRSVKKVRTLSEDGKEYRARVVDDLEDIESQFVYLLAFVKYCKIRYKDDMKEETHRVKFLASAYNCGFRSGSERIREMMERKFFSNGLFGKDYYSYSDISLFWYVNHQKGQE